MLVKIKHQFIKSFFCFIIPFFVVGCAKKNNSVLEITFWAMGAEGEHVGQLIPEFERTHPNVKIDLQVIPWSSAHEKLLTAFAGQSTPDVCQMGNTWIPEFQAIGALMPLDSLVSHSKIIESANYFPGIWQTNLIGNTIYGVPWYVDTRLLFYRSDILAKAGYPTAPQTCTEWRDAAQKIKQQNPQNYAAFFSLVMNDYMIPVILIQQNDGQLLKENNCRAAFDDSKTVEALEFYLSFFAEDLAPKNMTGVNNIFQAFSQGYFSMMITGPWNVNELRKRAPEIAGRWNTAVLPGMKSRSSVAGGASLVVFNTCKHSTEAWQFIEYLSEVQQQIEFFRLTNDLPAVKSAWQAPEIQADAQVQPFYEQLEHAVPMPQIPEWEQIAVKIQQHLEPVIFGKRKLPEAIQLLNQDADRILEKRRWLLENGLLK